MRGRHDVAPILPTPLFFVHRQRLSKAVHGQGNPVRRPGETGKNRHVLPFMNDTARRNNSFNKPT